jgi:hypothetical protein
MAVAQVMKLFDQAVKKLFLLSSSYLPELKGL